MLIIKKMYSEYYEPESELDGFYICDHIEV